ncbi:hypothetical protein [Arthrobacter oryzae]|nr:hypothetical protein [Arthrobacter oryzae]
MSRLGGDDVEVHVSDLSDDTVWSALSLTASPTPPDEEDEFADDFADDS